MNIQKSYLDGGSTLYLVPTPIGNFEDMTFRAIEVLKSVDYIYCEDTRITKVLLSHFDIKTPLRNYHIFNEGNVLNDIIDLLKNGSNIALVSDAGLPCISDPGYLLARDAISQGIKVVSLPGASAGLTGLIASGLPCEKFYFNGFLNSKQSHRRKQLLNLKDREESIIIYEAPHRILETLNDIFEVLGDRRICLCRELTKKFEEYIRGNVSEIINEGITVKGEMLLIIEGCQINSGLEYLNGLSVQEHFNYYLNAGFNEKDAIKKVANDRDVAKNEIYKLIKVK